MIFCILPSFDDMVVVVAVVLHVRSSVYYGRRRKQSHKTAVSEV